MKIKQHQRKSSDVFSRKRIWMKAVRYMLAIATTAICAVSATMAHADQGEMSKRRQQEENFRWEVGQKIRQHGPSCRPQKAKTLAPTVQPVLTTINCGDTITQSITVANDLDCSSTTGFALKIVGDGLIVNGNGHKIIAPNAAAGIFAQGSQITVSKFTVNGVVNGYGIMAYETPGIKITGNDFSRNSVGVMVFAENLQFGAEISGNKIQASTYFGIRTYSAAPGAVVSPVIKNNDLQWSGDYALYVKASSYTLSGTDGNNFANSTNGIYLKDGVFVVKDLSLAQSLIYKRGIFADSASSVTITNVDVSSLAPFNGNYERTGIDLYRVVKFEISSITSKNNDVGVKLETESGVSSAGVIKCSKFSGFSFAAIDIVSYDSTQYGTVRLCGNSITIPTNAYDVFIHNGTVVTILNQCLSGECSTGGCGKDGKETRDDKGCGDGRKDDHHGGRGGKDGKDCDDDKDGHGGKKDGKDCDDKDRDGRDRDDKDRDGRDDRDGKSRDGKDCDENGKRRS